MHRNHKICQEGGFEPEGFSGYGSGNFPVFFQYLVLLEIKRREGGFEPTGFLFQVFLKFVSIFVLIVLIDCAEAKTSTGQIPEKIPEKYPKNRSGSKPPSWQNLWFLFMICYYCIFQAQNKYWKIQNTGNLLETYPKKNPQARHHPSGSDLLFCLSSIPKGTFLCQNRAYSPTMGCK